MSLASVHPAELHSGRHSLAALSHSLDDISTSCSWSASSPHQSGFHSDHVLTIEELRFQMTSCFTCGVSWADHHVSLDCSECGGYALERPCPKCEGVCGAVWKRDLTMSHASSKARWEGACNFTRPATQESSSVNSSTTDGTVPTPQELCSRLENLSARS